MNVRSLKATCATTLAIGSLAVGGAGMAGDLIDDLLKMGGIGMVVEYFGDEMNRGINKLQGFSNSETVMTKVVPILSGGNGKHIGACQVMGPPNLVKKVRAVAQLETNFLGRVRMKAMVPVESEKFSVQNIRRVVGVGVSGIIDLKL